MSLPPADCGAQQPDGAAPPLFAAGTGGRPNASKHSHDHPAVHRQLTRGEATISDRSMGPPCVSTTTSGLVVVLAIRCSGTERDWSERHLEALRALQGLVWGCKAQMQLRSVGSSGRLSHRAVKSCYSRLCLLSSTPPPHLPQLLLSVHQLERHAVVALALHQPVILVGMELRQWSAQHGCSWLRRTACWHGWEAGR